MLHSAIYRFEGGSCRTNWSRVARHSVSVIIHTRCTFRTLDLIQGLSLPYVAPSVPSIVSTNGEWIVVDDLPTY
jgi:hypothetical protein